MRKNIKATRGDLYSGGVAIAVYSKLIGRVKSPRRINNRIMDIRINIRSRSFAVINPRDPPMGVR